MVHLAHLYSERAVLALFSMSGLSCGTWWLWLGEQEKALRLTMPTLACEVHHGSVMKTTTKTQAKTTKMIDLTAAETVADAMLFGYLDVLSPNHDRAFARQFALDNWTNLSAKARMAYRWAFLPEEETEEERTRAFVDAMWTMTR